MSTITVEVVKVDDILPHPSANRLEIAIIKEWNCVVPKGQFTAGCAAVYLPVDSVLPEYLEKVLFPPESKVKLHNRRVKTIKLRGAISQGLLVRLSELALQEVYPIGYDLTAQLGVTKYEPPESLSPQHGLQRTSEKQTNPNFHKYTEIENWKNYPTLFQPGEQSWILEKIHGTNFRAGYVPTHVNTIWKRIKRFFGLLPKYEFVYGSHNMQLQYSWRDRTWHYKTSGIKNVYAEAVDKYELRKALRPEWVIYGEVYGSGVQRGYTYDCQPGERKMRVFDVQVGGRWLNHDEVVNFCAVRGLLTVPIDVCGTFDPHDYVNAPSHLGTGLREGVVVKPLFEQHCHIGRKILKLKNDEFLLAQEDDTH